MIESYYWKQDLLKFAKLFKPVKNPSRWSEKLQVNFEKEVIISFFIIRKLAECSKLSPITLKHKAKIHRNPCIGRVNNRNFASIDDLYDLTIEEEIYKDVIFLCNQLIHGGAIYARRGADRNWDGIYTCSNFERQKFVYFIPVSEIVRALELAANDYPNTIEYKYDEKKETIRYYAETEFPN